jgi:ribulose-phosphate 3-epimerase
MVLIMSVNPGFGGQKFIPNTYKKLKDLKTLSQQKNPGLLIEVDGGVDQSNIEKLVEAGANVLVAGNSVFSSANQLAAISNLRYPEKLLQS